MRTLFLTVSLVFAAAGHVCAQSAIVPIAELKINGLIGGVKNGKWVRPETAARSMKEQTEFVLVGKNGVEEGGVSIGKLIQPTPNEPCDDFYAVEFELKMDLGVAIGSTAKWNFMPRAPREIGTENAAYKAVAAGFLKTKGIVKPLVKITRVVRIDLDGNGTDEVLISATHYRERLLPSAAKGDYSFVLLRTSRGKMVTNHLLIGEFYTKAEEFGAPSTHQISGIADLNGDGKMEIILNGFYYEGNFAGVFEMKNGIPVEIKELAAGCGL